MTGVQTCALPICLFIDDKEENKQAARQLGFHVITLRNPEEIKQKVREKIHEV